MAKPTTILPDEDELPRRPPGRTPDAREKEIISKAYDLVEKQIEEDRVSAQVLAHFIKRGSTREHIEEELIAAKVEMEKAKVEAMASQARVEELYEDAIKAMRSYSGQDEPEDEGDDAY